MKKSKVGYSDVTPVKQYHFREIIKKHINITKSIFKKYPGWAESTYYYFDINAGSGMVNGTKGSPLVFLKEAAKIRSMNFKVILFEINKDNCLKLSMCVAPFNKKNISITVHCADNREAIKEYFVSQKQKRYGIVYADANGIPDFDLLGKLSRVACYEKLDILINCPAAAIKKTRGCSLAFENKGKPINMGRRYLFEMMQEIDKTHWIIRDKYSSFQWTMMIASNWDAFPVFSKFGFYQSNSEKGKELLHIFNYSELEREKLIQRTIKGVA